MIPSCLVLAAVALVPQTVAPAPVLDPTPIPAERSHMLTPWGMALSLGGGVVSFTDDAFKDMADTGGAWEARLTVGTRLPVGVEGAYVGSAQELHALGLERNATLVSNGLETDIRVRFGHLAGLEPFGVAGLGWSRYDVIRSPTNSSSVASEDDVFFMPLGAGVATFYRGLILDFRFTWRKSFSEDLVRNKTGSVGSIDLDNWLATGRLGFEF